jgi:hypothetical protein
MRRTLRIVLIVAVGFGTSVAQGSNASYLALGDSIPFGFNPTVPLGDIADYHGYPQFVANVLGLSLANASCPGETSGSFLNVAAPDDGCQEWRAAGGPLFVTYSSLAESQLSYALSYLRSNPKTRLVTVTIGGDDLLLLEHACAAQSSNPSTIESCIIAGLGKVLAEFALNLTKIYIGLRLTAHYEGPIVAVNYFSPNYDDGLVTVAIGELNAITFGLTAAFGGKVADVFSAFQQASVAGGGLPCAPDVGLAFTTAIPGICDVHPTVAGQQLIATLVENLK